MAIHKLITAPGIYFVTFTSYHWLPLFELTNAYNLVYNWFDILTAKGHVVLCYVIMPNHLHLILYFSGGPQSLNTLVGNGKRFIGYEIINRLTIQNEIMLLKQLQAGVKPKDKSCGKKHELWQDSFDVKECRTEKFILQKLIYIHNNPCSGKWKLVTEPHLYPHSSALFYLNGKTAGYPVRDYRDFLWIYDDKNEG
jgi:REP element-mobilizing transposase RayT